MWKSSRTLSGRLHLNPALNPPVASWLGPQCAVDRPHWLNCCLAMAVLKVGNLGVLDPAPAGGLRGADDVTPTSSPSCACKATGAGSALAGPGIRRRVLGDQVIHQP